MPQLARFSKQTMCNEFIPCSHDVCHTLKHFCGFKIPPLTFIWPKSSYKHTVTRSPHRGKESGQRSKLPLWRHQWCSFFFIPHADDVKRETRTFFHVCNQSEARISTEHGINYDISTKRNAMDLTCQRSIFILCILLPGMQSFIS